MIRHTVAFKLKHAKGSEPEAAFLRDAQVLISIPTVTRFECLRQVSPKNGFDFGFSMEFASQADYEAYNEWLHYSEGSAMLPLMLKLSAETSGAPLGNLTRSCSRSRSRGRRRGCGCASPN